MNLEKLFDIQMELDNHIEEKHHLQGEYLLDNKIIALQVELGELANEIPETFKFWSNKKNNYEKALKEYVDCLHFILSIGNEAVLHYCQPIGKYLEHQTEIQLNNITDQFLHLFMDISGTIRLDTYIRIWNLFIGLGKMLGFTWEQVEQAYMIKNVENHKRQLNGY